MTDPWPGRRMAERDWQQQIVDAATRFGWRHYHTHDSRRSTAGFPDLVLVRPPDLLFVEVKTDAGRVTGAQKDWLADLDRVGAEVHVWRPKDASAVWARLSARRGATPAVPPPRRSGLRTPP